MTDTQISYDLAKAIGWPESDIAIDDDGCYVRFWPKEFHESWKWRTFDYRSADVIWPIAERYNAFPKQDGSEWCSLTRRKPPLFSTPHYSDTAAKAVALAIIGRAA